MVELAGLCARDEPRPVHRDALQRVWCVEGAAFLEAKRRAVALRDLTGPRVVERAAVALALLDELQAYCEWRGFVLGMRERGDKCAGKRFRARYEREGRQVGWEVHRL